MANNYNGRHVCKNHPKVNNKGTIILASLVLASSLSIFAINKDNEEMDIKNVYNSEISYVNEVDFSSILSSLKSKYILTDEYGLTFEGLVSSYFESQLSGIPNEEINKNLALLLHDSDIETKIFNYVVTNSPVPIKLYNYKDSSNMRVNLDKVLNNQELMDYIDTYSPIYGEDKGKIISIIAQNLENTNGRIDYKNPMGAGNKWYHLDSKYSVYNYSTNENEKINPINEKNIVNLKGGILYNIIISQSSIKQAGGDGIEALSHLKFGPNLLTLTDEEKETALNVTDEILSYLSIYFKRNSFNLTTNYTLNPDNTHVTTERVQSREYTYYVINDFINNLRITLNQDYNKTLN